MNAYTVKHEHDGFHVYYRGGWGIGYVFQQLPMAQAAARALNDNVSLDTAEAIDLTRAHGGRRFRPNPPQYVGEREGA